MEYYTLNVNGLDVLKSNSHDTILNLYYECCMDKPKKNYFILNAEKDIVTYNRNWSQEQIFEYFSSN